MVTVAEWRGLEGSEGVEEGVESGRNQVMICNDTFSKFPRNKLREKSLEGRL